MSESGPTSAKIIDGRATPSVCHSLPTEYSRVGHDDASLPTTRRCNVGCRRPGKMGRIGSYYDIETIVGCPETHEERNSHWRKRRAGADGPVGMRPDGNRSGRVIACPGRRLELQPGKTAIAKTWEPLLPPSGLLLRTEVR